MWYSLSMSTIIASVANLVICTVKCTKERLRKVQQAVRVATGRSDWTINLGT